MSVSDPLIKDIKGHTLKLFNESQNCNKLVDSSENLLEFCHTLENIFYKGFINKHQNNFYGINKIINVDTWMFTVSNECEDITQGFVYKNSVEEVRNCKTVCTSIGKFRLLVRHCLVKKCLHIPLEALMKSKKTDVFYTKNSIIGDEILLAILLSVLLQCTKINFQLHLKNHYFLDSTWQLPDIIKLELVPCKSLGISVSFSDNKAVIVHIRPNSVASESVDISKGDILANLNGVEINSSCKGRLNSILRINKGQPIALVVIKAFFRESEDIFLPIKNILVNLQIDVNTLKSSLRQNGNDIGETCLRRNSKSGYKARYLGLVDVGNKGSVKQIEEAMKYFLISSNNTKKEKPVILEIGEMSVNIFDAETNEIIFKHSYMQISSCGSTPNRLNYIAYIAGNENCDTASKFTCYIFYIEDVEEAYTILQSIGQGFYRTHFAV